MEVALNGDEMAILLMNLATDSEKTGRVLGMDALRLACEFIADRLRVCPHLCSRVAWTTNECGRKTCGDTKAECWRYYFQSEAKEGDK